MRKGGPPARESDPETGLYYYRARYYDPSVGRFLSEDPMQFQGGINFYRYTSNNPIIGRDPFGLWDSYTHGTLYWIALKECGLDNDTIYRIQQASELLDETTQAPWDAYIHSMRAPFQSPQAALAERDNWIDSNLQSAKALIQTGPGPMSGAHWEDLFANATHTMTDSTSPAHMNNGVPILWPSRPNVWEHGGETHSIETWANMTPDVMQLNIKMIQQAYERVTGKTCGCSQ
jgi:RHS repeat-associated protein